MTDVYDEAALLAEMIDDLTPKSRVRDVELAPRGFDPAAMFLLKMNFANLFEPVGRAGTTYRCKGCQTGGLKSSDRERHYKGHVRSVGRKASGNGLAKTREVPYDPDTTSSGAQAPTPNDQGGNDMATATKDSKTTTTDAKPAGPAKVSKTKVARAAAIDVLVKANKPMDMSEIVEKVMSRKAVIDAGIPKGTVSAQINFELAEAEPKIVRFGRGVYGAKGVAAPVATETPTKRASTKAAADKAETTDEGKSDPAAAAQASADHNPVEAKPDPKPGSKK